MNIKTFPKSRVSVLDVYPAFEKGLRRALLFAEEHNISINSADGRRIILAYCLETIEKSYKNINSNYPLVLFINTDSVSSKLKIFVDKHLENIVKRLQIPYCGKFSIESPDLEHAAEKCSKEIKSKKTFIDTIKKLGIKKPLN